MTMPFEAAHTCWQLTYRAVSLPSLENAPRDTDVILLFSSDLERLNDNDIDCVGRHIYNEVKLPRSANAPLDIEEMGLLYRDLCTDV
jgi:hypothetical protein